MNASVIIPAYNCSNTIANAMKSVDESIHYCQKRVPGFVCEMVVVIDDATDNTESVAKSFVSSFCRKVILSNDKNYGAGPARNVGVRNSCGDLILFLDADDIFYPEHIYQCIAFMKKNVNVHWVQTMVRVEEEIHPHWRAAINDTVVFNLCIRRWVHDFVGGYPEGTMFKIGGCEDVLYRKLLLNFFKGARIEEETVNYRRYNGNALDRQMQKFKLPPDEGMSARTDQEKRIMPKIAKYYNDRVNWIEKQLTDWVLFLQKPT